MKHSSPARRVLLRTVYLLPLLLFLTFCIYASLPHLWFVYDRQAYDTMSLFDLQGNTWEACAGYRNSGEAALVNFGNVMAAASILFWVALVVFGVFAVLVAVCSLSAFALPPASPLSNRIKRISGLIAPNRLSYLILSVLPLLPAFFPQVLALASRSFLGVSTRAHAHPLHAWVLMLILILVNLAAFLLTLPWQSEERLDLFRIYRSSKKASTGGDRT